VSSPLVDPGRLRASSRRTEARCDPGDTELAVATPVGPPEARFVHRRFASLAGRGLAVLALLVFAASETSHAAERVRVALLPVVVHSNDNREYLQQGLADMLVARLGRDPRVAPVKVDEASAATTVLKDARAAGRKAGAEYVLFGSFTRFGEGASLDLQCARVADDSDPPRKIFAQAVNLSTLIPMLDGVSEKVTAYVLGKNGDVAASSGAAATATGDTQGEINDLRRRVEALERIVYSGDMTTPKRPAGGTGGGGTEGHSGEGRSGRP
jgi:TolB-like protein